MVCTSFLTKLDYNQMLETAITEVRFYEWKLFSSISVFEF